MPTETINIDSQVRVQVTRAEMQALIAANEVSAKKIYTISDGGPSDHIIDVFGLSSNEISTLGFNQTESQFGYYDVGGDTWKQIGTNFSENGVSISNRPGVNFVSNDQTGVSYAIVDDSVNQKVDFEINEGSWCAHAVNSLDVTATGVTSYYSLFGGQIIDNTTESNRRMPMPHNIRIKNLVIYLTGAQPGTGSVTLTIRVQSVDSALSVVIAAGSAVGTYSNLVNEVDVDQLEYVSLKSVNAAALNSGTLSWAFSHKAIKL